MEDFPWKALRRGSTAHCWSKVNCKCPKSLTLSIDMREEDELQPHPLGIGTIAAMFCAPCQVFKLVHGLWMGTLNSNCAFCKELNVYSFLLDFLPLCKHSCWPSAPSSSCVPLYTFFLSDTGKVWPDKCQNWSENVLWLCFWEPIWCWDVSGSALMKCDYSGTPLWRPPLGKKILAFIERRPYLRGGFELQNVTLGLHSMESALKSGVVV